MKNKKIVHKILSLLLVLSITSNCFNFSISSAKNETNIDSETFSELNEHIEMTLPGYLRVNNLLGFEVTVSEPMIINNWNEDGANAGNESYICFVINNSDDTIIGKLTLAKYNGEIYSSFDFENLDTFNAVYKSGTPVVFGTYDLLNGLNHGIN